MSYSLFVLSPSEAPVAKRDVAQFIEDGVYFDPEPQYDTAPEGDLGKMVIRYDPHLPPIVIARIHGEEATAVIGEALDATYAWRAPDKALEALRKRLRETRSAIAFEVDRETLTEDAWAMLDSLEAEFMRTLGGVLYAPDDGFYDADLKLIAGVKK